LVIDRPTIGVAKSLLCGEVGAFNQEGWAPITDNDEIVGAAVSTERLKPVYVSTGHKVSLERAINIIVHCTLRNRIPEPIRVAHILANEEKRKRKKPEHISKSKITRRMG
jgi:deoxyribonuclease V